MEQAATLEGGTPIRSSVLARGDCAAPTAPGRSLTSPHRVQRLMIDFITVDLSCDVCNVRGEII